jgi:hypothetical protein
MNLFAKQWMSNYISWDSAKRYGLDAVNREDVFKAQWL